MNTIARIILTCVLAAALTATLGTTCLIGVALIAAGLPGLFMIAGVTIGSLALGNLALRLLTRIWRT